MSSDQPNTPKKDFDDFNTQEVRRLTAELTAAQQKQEAAQAVCSSLSTRLAAFQKTLVTAQTNSAAATANLAVCQSITQTVDKAGPLAQAAADQAEEIVKAVYPVYTKAYETALRMIEALNKVDALNLQIEQRVGKNDFTSANIVNGVASLTSDGAAALAAVTAALQKTMLAYADAMQAHGAARQVIASNQRLRNLLAPGSPFNPQVPNGEGLWPVGEEPADSISVLARKIKAQDLTIQAVLDSLAKIALYLTQEQQAGTTQTALQLNSATGVLNHATARVAAAQASLVAADNAVA